MRRGTKVWLLVEAIVLGAPITLLTLFYLPWVLMYAGVIVLAALRDPLEGILFVGVALFFLSGPLAILAFWWMAWSVILPGNPPRRWVLVAASLSVVSACVLFFSMFGGVPKTLNSLHWTHAIVAAPLLGWIHFLLIVRRRRRPPPLSPTPPLGEIPDP